MLDHGGFAPILDELAATGVEALPGQREALAAYRASLAGVDPDALTRAEALAYWLNLYNAEALALAGTAVDAGASTVLRVPGAFDRPRVTVAGEELSLNDIEHGKVRRFRDPRVHGALVCGSVSCPTLRYEPFSGDRVAAQLDDQMRTFVAGGGAELDRSGEVLRLSRVFLWYGADFTRPHRMPTILPATRGSVAAAVSRWLPPDDAGWVRQRRPRVAYQRYDWGLSCAIR